MQLGAAARARRSKPSSGSCSTSAPCCWRVGVLRTRAALRAVEPALAAGATIVIGYGLAGRLLPGIVELERSRSAGGRLEQPITYWNAEGALAAVGLVLCARLAGDRTRPLAVRALAAAAAPRRSAPASTCPTRAARSPVAVLGLVAARRAGADARPAARRRAGARRGRGGGRRRRRPAGRRVARRRDRSATARSRSSCWSLARRRRRARGGPLRRRGRPLPQPRRLAAAPAAVVAAAVAVGLVVGGLAERPTAAELSAGARRRAPDDGQLEPLRVLARRPGRVRGASRSTGLGAAGFRVEWLRERSIPEAVRDAHSLEVEIAAELGCVGLLAFALMVAGVRAGGAPRAARAHRRAAAGPVAALSSGSCTPRSTGTGSCRRSRCRRSCSPAR